MKHLVIILIVCIFFPIQNHVVAQIISPEKVQQTKQLVSTKLREIYSNKTNKPDSMLRVDTSLTRVAEIMSSDTFQRKVSSISRDKIRELLRRQKVYDYQVHYVSLPVNDLQSEDIHQALEKNDSLQSLLKNPHINRQGIAIKQKNGKFSLHVLFTENYMDVSYIIGVGIVDETGGNQTLKIINRLKGTSSIKELFYIPKAEEKKYKVPLDTLVISDHSLGGFGVDKTLLRTWKDWKRKNETMHPFIISVPAKPIEFLDASGKIVAEFRR